MNSELSAEEISKSIYYIRVRESFNAFQQSDNPDIKIDNYHSFLNDLNNFISNEPNKNLIKFTVTSMISTAMQFSTNSIFNQEDSYLLFDILDKILQITMDFNYSDFLYWFFSLLTVSESIELLKSHQKTLEKIFSDENYFSYLVNQQKIPIFFEKTFTEFKSLYFCQLFHHLICEISPLSIRKNINLSNILSFLLTQIPHEIQIEYSIVLSKLVSTNSMDRLFLNRNQSFFLFSEFIQSASSEIIINCFNDLVFTNPTNLELFSNLILFYQKYPQHQTPLFQWIFKDVINDHNDMLHEINQVVPFFGWIAVNTTVVEVIDAIVSLSKYDDSFNSPFISPLFSLLNKGESKFDEYSFIIQLIENQILLHHISLKDLLNWHFLEAFIINIKIDILGQLFEKVYTFSQLVYDVFTLPKSEPFRSDIISKLIQMTGKFPQNSHFISVFLIVSNSIKNISDLMTTIIENKNSNLCIALGDSFVKSDSVINYFIENNGIEWLDKILNINLIDLKQFVFLLNSLTKKFYIKEVDAYIESLPKSHPIFTLGQDDLMLLSYGFEKSHYFYPLKITALFHLIKCPQIIDPYNACMIGKHVFEKILYIDDLPIFSEIVNRYITDNAFIKLIDMDPLKFGSFCESNFDHFPLFQINEFFDNNVFEIKYKAISFWFKFGETFIQEIKVPFFISGKFQLSMKNSQLYANYEGVEYDVKVDPNSWNNIIIATSSEKMSHNIDVYVNLNKAVFTSPSQLNEMPSFEFSTYSAYLFVGPSIRIYKNELVTSDIEIIFKNGVSFCDHLNETQIISPSSGEFINITKNVFPVEYQGFPFHLLSKEKMDILFNRMTNQNLKQIEFNSMISTCFKVYSIFNNSIQFFFHWILSIFSKVPQFVNINLLVKSINFFLKYKNKSEIIDTIVGNEPFWSNVSNYLIIASILTVFNDFDFYKEKKKLDNFLSIKSYFIRENPRLLEHLIKSSKESASIIHELFLSSNFLSEKQNKFTQFNFELKNKNFEDEILREQNNISIQCNLINNENIQENCDDSINLFQTTNMTQFQRIFIDFMKIINITKENLFYFPINDIYSLFITSDTELKALVYPIMMNYEKVVPNSIQFNLPFLFNSALLFNYKTVWISTFDLLTQGSNEIVKQSILPIVFSLFWGYLVASLHSISSTGKSILNEDEISEEITKITKFLLNENNIKIILNDKNVLKIVVTLFPFILGVNQNNGFLSKDEKKTSQNFNLNGLNYSSPKPLCFISMIWKSVINEAGLIFETKNDYFNELQTFMIRSKIFIFFFKYIFLLPESDFKEVLGAFMSVPFISENNELSNCFINFFIHSLLNFVTENFSHTSKIYLILPFIHILSISGRIDEKHLPIVIGDLFLISSVFHDFNEPNFHELSPNLNLLILNLLVSVLKICYNSKNKEDCMNMVDTLYLVFYQEIRFLIAIVNDSRDTFNLYLNFFEESAQFCSEKELFQKVVEKFGKALKIDQTTQFQFLLHFTENNKQLEMEKWKFFINLKILPSINQNEISFSLLPFLNDCSKSFTVLFLNSLEKQKQTTGKLKSAFNEMKEFQESKISWYKSFYEIP